MKYYRVNTDRLARKDIKTGDLWYKHGMAFAGDKYNDKVNHIGFFQKVKIGDGIFMHQSQEGIIGYGIVIEEWDGIKYKGKNRLLYIKEPLEYRIVVDWESKYDRRNNPLPINGNLHYAGYYSEVKHKQKCINDVLAKLKK